MFELFGITFYLYGLLIGLGVWVAIEIALTNSGGIKKEVLEKTIIWVVLGGILGARLYHVVDFWSRYYSTNLEKILFFWEGGLGIWGAIVGGLLGLLIYCHFNKLNFVKILDTVIIGVPLAQTIGRIGNFFNKELYGKNGEPLFVYEGVLNLILFYILRKKPKKQRTPGVISGIYLIGYGTIRILLENLRPDEIIWKINGVPVAVAFGVVAILVGGVLIFQQKRA